MVDVTSRSDTASRVTLGIVRGISYGLFRPPEPFGAPLRALGARLVRGFLYWSQIEPEPGRLAFETVDHWFEQLDASVEVWITVCSSSPWATRQSSTFLPPSPAKDADTYRRFLRALVGRCKGRVRYWQCDNEPSNVGLTWAGTAEEYLAQLRVFHDVVTAVDPRAEVVLGGAPYGLPASAKDAPERQFFDVLLREGRDSFDLFDLHLYGDAERIPADIDAARSMMRAHGYEKPIVAGEHGGPAPDLYPEAQSAIQEVMTAIFAGFDPSLAVIGQTPERAAMAALYERMATLPPQLQMFMAGCPPELEAKRHRIHCRELVMRTVQALASGIRVMACWKLAPEVSNYEDPLSIMELFYGKLLLLAYREGVLAVRQPAGDTFALLAERLAGVESASRIDVPGRQSQRLFEARRRDRGPLLVAWNHADSFDGENQPSEPLSWPWPAERATAVDAFGTSVLAQVHGGRVSVPVSVTPVFIATH